MNTSKVKMTVMAWLLTMCEIVKKLIHKVCRISDTHSKYMNVNLMVFKSRRTPFTFSMDTFVNIGLFMSSYLLLLKNRVVFSIFVIALLGFPIFSVAAGGDYYSLTTVPSKITVGITTAKECKSWDGKAVNKVEVLNFRYYVQVVLFSEVGPMGNRKWSYEALKAMAMAIKTFAWYKMLKGGRKVFNNDTNKSARVDVVSNTCDQLYDPNKWDKAKLYDPNKLDKANLNPMQLLYRKAALKIWPFVMKIADAKKSHVLNVFLTQYKANCGETQFCMSQNNISTLYDKDGKTVIIDGVGKNNWKQLLKKHYSSSTDIFFTTTLQQGDQVQVLEGITIDGVPARNMPSVNNSEVKGLVPSKCQGEILAGPKQGDYIPSRTVEKIDWYKIDWSSCAEELIKWSVEEKSAWSVDAYLKPLYTPIFSECKEYIYEKVSDFIVPVLAFCEANIDILEDAKNNTKKSRRKNILEPSLMYAKVSRAEYVKIIVKALNIHNFNLRLIQPIDRPFNDVATDNKFAPYIQYAKDKGIIQGCGEAHFCPDEYITKAEGIKIVIAGFKDKFSNIFNAFSNGKEPIRLFNDVTDKSAWFYPYVYTAKESHLLHGYKDNSFKPNELMSRANMAKVVCIAAFGPMECSNMGDTARSVVFAVTPDTATVNEPITFTLEGFNLPIPVTLAIPDCANITPVSGGTAEKQQFQCTPTLAGLKNATVNAPDGTVLVEFAVEVDDISTPPPPPSCTPSVIAVSPLTAVLNQTQVFTVKGLCLPETTVFSIAECDDLARLDGDEQQQQFRCLPNSTGDKPGVVKDEPEGTVLHDFTVSVTEDSTPTTPTPLEGDGLIHDEYRPGDATQLFILNDTMTTTCTFSDVAPSPEFAEAVNALCSAGILVGYWEKEQRVFIKLDPDNPNISRDDSANKMTKAILAEILKVFLFAVDYDYFGVRHVNDSETWYQLFIDEAKNRGLDLHDLSYKNQVTRGQAMTWLAQLFYDYTGSDPIALLDSKGITNGERPNDALTRYELALLTYRAILDTDKTDEIHFGLFDAPAPKLPSSNDSSFGQSVAKQALAAVGQTYPYVDSQYTYSARFVRTQFEKRVKWPDAKSLCQHYDDFGVMATSETPPAGAVICYLPGETNWYYGHVAIAIGDGTEIGVTSLTDGVTQRDIYLGTGYQGWIGAEDFESHYP